VNILLLLEPAAVWWRRPFAATVAVLASGGFCVENKRSGAPQVETCTAGANNVALQQIFLVLIF
jgi:hypothetical protein